MQSATRKPVTFRFSDVEREQIAAAAAVNGETVSNWVRRTLLAAAKKAK